MATHSPFAAVLNPELYDQQIGSILFDLPPLRAGDGVEDDSTEIDPHSSPGEMLGRSSTLPVILFVEDDLGDARLIMRAMERVNIPARVVHVKNGDEAVAYLSRKAPFNDAAKFPQPYLVLMDAKLPRRWGLEVLHWIREQKSGIERVPVVMLTSSQHAVDIRQAYDYGVNSYLVKPQTSEQTLRMVNLLKEYWFTLNQGPPQDRK